MRMDDFEDSQLELIKKALEYFLRKVILKPPIVGERKGEMVEILCIIFEKRKLLFPLNIENTHMLREMYDTYNYTGKKKNKK